MVADHVLGHESNSSIPSLGRLLIEYIVYCKLVRVVCRQLVQFLLQQDIAKCDVCIDEGDSGMIMGVLQDGANDLQHWCDSCAAGNHAQVRAQSWLVVELSLWSFDANPLPNREKRDVAGNVALLVCFDHKIKMASVVIRRSRCIRASYYFPVDFSLNGNVLADRETKNIVWVGETKSVAKCDMSATHQMS